MLQENELEQKTKIIQHKETNIQLSFLEIGKILLEIKESKLYGQKYFNFDTFIKENFSFSAHQAYKFIAVANQFPQLSSTDVTSQLGVEKLYLLTQLPDKTEVEEIIGEVEDNHLPTIKELQSKIKKHHIEPSVPVETRTEMKDQARLLERQGNSLLNEIEDIKETEILWKKKAIEWIHSTTKYPELKSLSDDIIQKMETHK